MARPLLVIDGDSLRPPLLPRAAEVDPARERGAGAIVGFANFLLRLYEDEAAARGARRLGHARSSRPTGRSCSAAYQGGREFDAEIIEQLEVLPEFVAACGFVNGKGAATRPTTSWRPRWPREWRGGRSLVASGDRDAFQLASERTTIAPPGQAGEMARIGPAEVRERYGVEPRRCPTSSRCAAIPSDRMPGARGVGPKSAASADPQIRDARNAIADGRLAGGGATCASTAASRRWTPVLRCPRCGHRYRRGRRRRGWRASGSLTGSANGWTRSPREQRYDGRPRTRRSRCLTTGTRTSAPCALSGWREP